jgi:nitrogen-specific signal transduction histidine kinase
MSSNVIAISKNNDLVFSLKKNHKNIIIYEELNVVDELHRLDSAIIVDLRGDQIKNLSESLNHIENEFRQTEDSVLLIVDELTVAVNFAVESHSFIYNAVIYNEKFHNTFLKAFKNFINYNKNKDTIDDIQVREKQYKNIVYQLKEIFQFEESMQLNFFEMDIENVVQMILNKIDISLQTSNSFFFSFDPKSNAFMYKSSSKKTHLGTEFSIKYDDSAFLKEIIAMHSGSIYNKIEEKHFFYHSLENVFHVNITSAIVVPVFENDDLYGFIISINKKYRRKFTEMDLAFIHVASTKITMVLDQKMSWYSFATDSNKVITQLTNERDDLRDILRKLDFGILIFSKSYDVHFYSDNLKSMLGSYIDSINPKSLNDIFEDEIIEIIMSSQSSLTQDTDNEFVIDIGSDKYKKIGFTLNQYYVNEISEMGFILTFKDITNPINSKENLYRVDKLASLGVLASGIAHEIRNPLAGISTIAETLAEELESEELQEYTDRIIRQVNRLSKLLKSFFSFAKPSRPEKTLVSIVDLFQEVLPILKNKLKEKSILLNEFYEEDLEKVRVDSNQIEQVLFNVLLNAIDAIQKGGRLKIVVTPAINLSRIVNKSRFKFSITNAKYIEILISDTGKGMPSDIVEKVFDPFFTTKAEGTGLGLSIVHQIIYEHDGMIDIESSEDDGTDFRIFLPIDKDDE